MLPHILIRLTEIADHLDRDGEVKEVNSLTSIMTRTSQFAVGNPQTGYQTSTVGQIENGMQNQITQNLINNYNNAPDEASKQAAAAQLQSYGVDPSKPMENQFGTDQHNMNYKDLIQTYFNAAQKNPLSDQQLTEQYLTWAHQNRLSKEYVLNAAKQSGVSVKAQQAIEMGYDQRFGTGQ